MQCAQVTQGADLGGQYAAALAAASILFKATDGAYAAKLLDAAKRSYKFAEASQGAKCALFLHHGHDSMCLPDMAVGPVLAVCLGLCYGFGA